MLESEREQFQLGIFMPNCRHAYCSSGYKPEPDDWTYESNKNIAQVAEAAGFDFPFPVSRWCGFSGLSIGSESTAGFTLKMLALGAGVVPMADTAGQGSPSIWPV